ncbi:hypothetical protein BLNAU_3202 [Blattamonas nauphoetae]|uniref:Uncharacterized protein n=1 Tax=Blattamonas nauphoetae TaxID=2049346 RepID=A0ABQ9YDB9_9EUKA|nr:hypothetical protein BLNAU_3202 [Blattamonas nauphoetae]
MAFQSLLSKVEDEDTHQFIIELMSDNISKWKKEGAETWGRGRILLQTLEMEGFHEGLEQTLHHDKSSNDGRTSLNLSKQCDIHFCLKLTDHTPAEPLTRYASNFSPVAGNSRCIPNSFALFAFQHSQVEFGTARIKQSLILDCYASGILTHQDSEFHPGLWRSLHPICGRWRQCDTGGHRAQRTPDPGTDGLVHADTHLTMSNCIAQAVIVGLSPIFGTPSSSVDVSLSAFANLNHAIPLLYPPLLPALQPPSIPSLANYSTLVAYSTMVSVFDHIFAGIAYAQLMRESFFRCDIQSEQQTLQCGVL